MPVRGLMTFVFLIFQTRERRGSTSRMATNSVGKGVSTAVNPTPYGFSGPTGIDSQLTCEA